MKKVCGLLPRKSTLTKQQKKAFSFQSSFYPLYILKTKERLNQILSDLTGQPLEVIEQDTDRDNFKDADEALEYGLIDGIMKNSKELNKSKK